MSSITNNCSCNSAFHCAWKTLTTAPQILEGESLWNHPKMDELEKLKSEYRPEKLDLDKWMIIKAFHGTTESRINDQLQKITLGKQDALDKRNPFFFDVDKELCAGYAWPGRDQGETPVLLKVLIKGDFESNEYNKMFTFGNKVYPMQMREFLGKEYLVMCKPAKIKLKQMGIAGIGGLVAITAATAGKWAYKRFQSSKKVIPAMQIT